jgi:hypothetical protein
VNWLVPIAVAIIGGPVVVLLQLLRRENTNQHAESRTLLEHVAVKIDKVSDKLDEHIKDGHNG